MKIGTIDIGTNSMRLLTAVYKDGNIYDMCIFGKVR